MSFPPESLSGREDSSKLTSEQVDPTISSSTDGGYLMTRPRYTRKPPINFTTGFTYITQAEKKDLEDFWDEQFGGSRAFAWDNPTDGVRYNVRFAEPMRFSYTGKGGNHRWNVSVKLRTI